MQGRLHRHFFKNSTILHHYQLFSACSNKKMYILSQFPYPSGELHLGHARVYYIGDSLAKYYRLKQFDVLYPMGFDSFGLPAENAAINHNLNPRQWTNKNISSMIQQLHTLGVKFDWDNTFVTSQKEYYRWTQEIFVKMFNKGLAYQGMGTVNWDPIDKTVLANEQVDKDGRSWRSGALVEKRQLKQWYFSISKYAKSLQQNLGKLQHWIDRVKSMQEGWIGYRQGFFVEMQLLQGQKSEKVNVFVEDLRDLQDKDLRIKRNYDKSVELTQSTATIINPLTHQLIQVVNVYDNAVEFELSPSQIKNNHPELSSDRSVSLKYYQTSIMKLNDWLISRQRYWGTPIPIIHCHKCGVLPVPSQQLPVVLPEWTGKTNPLLLEQFIKCKCHQCGGQARRETDTMDTFVDSSWYYLRFLDSKNTQQICSSERANKMMPVDIYIGGIQHAIMHLLYARFVMHFLAKEEQICLESQPFKELIVQGLVKGRTFKLKQSGRYLKENEIKEYKKQQIEQTYQKMSKSKFNGLNPTEVVKQYGADTLRMALFFAAPPEHDIDFNTELLVSIKRFLGRVEDLIEKLGVHGSILSSEINKQILTEKFSDYFYRIKKTIEKLENSIEGRHMHAYIANLMELFNEIKKQYNPEDSSLKIQSLYLTITDIFLPALSVVGPETTLKILQHKLFRGLKIENLRWIASQQFTSLTEYLVMRGNKLLERGRIGAKLGDEQIKAKVENQLGSRVQAIKRNKKNIIVIIK